jgi:MFS family permease
MGRILLIGFGILVMAFGGLQLVWNVPTSEYVNLAVWLAAGVVLHDMLLAGLVAACGWLMAKVLPKRYRSYAQAGIIVAGIVAIMSIPVVVGAGRKPDNPSLLPLDYSRNLVIVVAVIALVTILLAILSRRPEKSAGEGKETPAL